MGFISLLKNLFTCYIILGMFNELRSFVRGCIVDPELEQKLHILADESLKTVAEVKKATAKVPDLKSGLVLAGFGLLVAGFIAGSATAKETVTK